MPRCPKIERDTHVDVVVVGGGFTGLISAYLLTKAGRSVVVLERRRCAQVDTGHTSAHLTMVTDTRLTALVKRFGQTHAQAVWDAGLAAIDQIDTIIRQHGIQCGFAWVDGFLHSPVTEAGEDAVSELQAEAALAQELGFDAEFVAEVPLVGRPGIRFDSQARIHPRQFLAGLVGEIHRQGGRIHEHSAVEEFCEKPLGVKANGCTITCDDIILATHNPLVGVSSFASATLFQTKLALYTSYVLAGRVPRGEAPDALWWDTADPYQYLRMEPHHSFDVVIFGGEDHKTGQVSGTAACYERLEEALRKRLPEITITHRWSGQVIATPDGLPFLGATAEHQFVATGFNGNGLTFGTLGAMMCTDAILGQANPWTELFEPGRSALRRGWWNYIQENSDYPYYLIRDRFAGVQGRSLRSVQRGQGKILELDGSKVAAYRDENGATTLRSAICSHMGCVVGWNALERTWDCPCHGSRFTPDGKVLSGPAESPLAEPGSKPE